MGTESDAEQARRLATAKEEYAARDDFDFQIVNQNVNEAAEAVVNLLSEARNRKA